MSEPTQNILLVEDSAADALLITELMGEIAPEFHIKTADQLSSALKELREESNDVVLLDLGLPDSVGIDSLRAIQDKVPDLPIVVLTGFTQEELPAKALAAGAQDYLIKGKFSGDTLYRSITYAIERKRAEVAMKRLSRRTELILATAGEGILGLDTMGTIIFLNNAAADMFGYEVNEMIGQNCSIMYHHSKPDGSAYPIEDCPIDAAFRQGSDHYGEEVFWRKNGASFPVDFTSRPLYENHIIIGAVVTFRDITERKHAEAARAYLSAIVESTNVAIISLTRDLNGTIKTWNKGAEKVYGFRAEEAVGRDISLLMPPDGPDDVPGILDRIKRGETVKGYETIRMRKDGVRIYVSLDVSPIRTSDGEIIGASTIAHDITDRKLAEEAQRRSEQRFSAFMLHLPAAAWIKDLQGRYVYANAEAERIFLVPLQTLLGKTDFEIFPHKTAQQFVENDQRVLREGGSLNTTEMLPQSDGIEHNFIVSKFSVSGSDGRPAFIAGVAFDITDRKQAEDALREGESRLHAIASTALDAVILIDDSGNVSFWNHAATKMFGYAREEIIGKYLHSYVMPERHVDAFRRGFEAFQKTGKGPFIGTVYEIEAKRKDGTEFPVELSLSSVIMKGKWNAVGIVRDITDRKRLERSLNRSYGLMKTIIDSMSEAISLIDVMNFTIVAVNNSFLKEYGYSDESEVIGKRCYEVTHRRNAVCEPPDDICPLENTVKTGETFAVEHVHYRKDGEKLYFEISTSPIKDENDNVVQVVHVQRNITERKRMEEEIIYMAHHDPLTGLLNRRLFIDILNVERNQAVRHRNKMAIFFLDLDRFKEVNDTLGHEAGDLLLKEAASRLKAVIRKSDTIARIGGDEFNIILAELVRAEDSADIARKIVESFQKPFAVSGNQLRITTSVGISIYPDDSEDVETLQRYADIAMYHAKENGRNKYQFYNPSINVRSLEQIKFENMLRRSIDQGELVIYYQPLVDIKTRRVVCAEALARWRHPQKGLLEPKDFIHAAEASGFINEIDEWALTTVCRQVTAWLKAGNPPVCVTVNVSARQFQDPDLVKKVSTILTETGMPPNCLDIEITETIAMTDVERSTLRLKELTKMGIRISIDDFGTGYSSLNYLKRFPIERLKIDKTFVQDIATDPDDRSIVKAVTAMAHNMKMKVVAEGVETEEQLEFLRKTGCDEMQGFLFSKPLTAEAFVELLKAA